MKPDEVLPISASLQRVGRPVAYYPKIAKALGGVKTALFLCQFLYLDGKQYGEWIYKTQAEISEETGLSRREQESARKELKEFGILEESLKGVPAQLHYKFHWDALDRVLMSKIGDTVQTSMAESAKLDWRKAPNYHIETTYIEPTIKAEKSGSLYKLEKETEVLNHLNLKTGKQFRPVDANLDFITGRLKGGASVEDCKWVVDHMAQKWKGTEQEHYLRPATLFNKTKFEQYLGDRRSSKPQSTIPSVKPLSEEELQKEKKASYEAAQAFKNSPEAIAFKKKFNLDP